MKCTKLDGTQVDPGTVETDATTACGTEACFMGKFIYYLN